MEAFDESWLSVPSLPQPCATSQRLRIDLLRDERGIYGYGDINSANLRVMLRPDRVEKWDSSRFDRVALQMVPYRFNYRGNPFRKTLEARMIDGLHTQAVTERLPPRDASQQPDKESTKKYHGYRSSARRIVNAIIYQALSAADQPSLAIARRYPLSERGEIYASLVTCGSRARQMAEVFPALFSIAYTDRWRVVGSFASYEEEKRKAGELRVELQGLIQRGARLRIIAEAATLPIALRHVAPCVASLAIKANVTRDHLRFLPPTAPKQRIWLSAMEMTRDQSPELRGWVARHALELGKRSMEARSRLSDIRDWVNACDLADIPDHAVRVVLANTNMWSTETAEDLRKTKGCRYLTRKFSASMNLRTVERLSNEWHEAISQAEHDGKPKRVFPSAWYDGTAAHGFIINPIESSDGLYLEGKRMHNCVATYQNSVATGQAYFYSVQKDWKHIATVMLVPKNGSIALGDMRGPCNAVPDAKAKRAVQAWLRKNIRDHGVGRFVEFHRETFDDLPF